MLWVNILTQFQSLSSAKLNQFNWQSAGSKFLLSNSQTFVDQTRQISLEFWSVYLESTYCQMATKPLHTRHWRVVLSNLRKGCCLDLIESCILCTTLFLTHEHSKPLLGTQWPEAETCDLWPVWLYSMRGCCGFQLGESKTERNLCCCNIVLLFLVWFVCQDENTVVICKKATSRNWVSGVKKHHALN